MNGVWAIFLASRVGAAFLARHGCDASRKVTRIMLNRRNALALALALTCFTLTCAVRDAVAQQVAASTSADTILTIGGKVREGRPVELTRADIERLPRAVIRTTTPWHEGVQVFEGVPLADLLNHVGAAGAKLSVVALNHYKTEIPVADVTAHRPILAYLRNGNAMPVRDKGPLFVIYPYDASPALKNEVYYSRSAWQVRSIVVE